MTSGLKSTPEPADRRPATIGPGADPTPTQLAEPGTVIRRWTRSLAAIDPLTGRPVRVAVPMPCHPRQHVTVPSEMIVEVAVCRVCSRTYDLSTWDEGDGGYAAQFTVAYRPFHLSDARSR